MDHEKVKSRHLPQSVGCGKNFLGPEKLNSAEQVSIHTHTYVNVHGYIHIRMCMYGLKHTYVCMYLCTYSVYVYMCMYVCICMDICVKIKLLILYAIISVVRTYIKLEVISNHKIKVKMYVK